MTTNGQSADPRSESHESVSEALPRSLLLYGIQGMMGGLPWAVLIAIVLNATRAAEIVLSGEEFRFSREEFLITFLIVPVWVVIAGIVGLIRGAEKRGVSSALNQPSLPKHLLVGVAGIPPHSNLWKWYLLGCWLGRSCRSTTFPQFSQP